MFVDSSQDVFCAAGFLWIQVTCTSGYKKNRAVVGPGRDPRSTYEGDDRSLDGNAWRSPCQKIEKRNLSNINPYCGSSVYVDRQYHRLAVVNLNQ